MGLATAGYLGSVKVGSNVVANIKDWDLPMAATMTEVSVLGVGAKQYIPTLLDGTAKLTGFLDTTDTNGQIALQNAYLAGTLLSINLYVTASHYYAFSAYVKTFNPKVTVNAAVDVSIDLQITGTVSYT